MSNPEKQIPPGRVKVGMEVHGDQPTTQLLENREIEANQGLTLFFLGRLVTLGRRLPPSFRAWPWFLGGLQPAEARKDSSIPCG